MPYEQERRAREEFVCHYCQTKVKKGETYLRTIWPPQRGKDRRKGLWLIEKAHRPGDCVYEDEDYFGHEDEFNEGGLSIQAMAVHREAAMLNRNGDSSSSTITSIEYVVSYGQAVFSFGRRKNSGGLLWEGTSRPLSYRDIEIGAECLWVQVDVSNRMRLVQFRIETLPWQDQFGWWLWADIRSVEGNGYERIALEDAGLSPTGAHHNWHRTFHDTEENRDFLTRVALLYPIQTYLEFAGIIDDFIEVPF